MKSNRNSVLEILATFEKELKEKNVEGEIVRVKYYDDFNIKGINFYDGLFIVMLNDEQKKSFYQIYASDPENKIMSIDSEGNVIVHSENLEDFIGEEITLEDIMTSEENEKEKLKGITQKTNQKEVEKYIEDEKDLNDNRKNLNSEELVEKDLKELDIISYRKIEDPNLEQQLGISFSGATEKGMAYSKELGGFVLVEKVEGKFRKVEGTEISEPTFRSVISINEDGQQIEKKVPHALMKTNNPRKELSITIGDYGYIEAATVDVLPCNMRVEMPLEEVGEGIKGRRIKTLEDLGNKEGKEAIHGIAHDYEELEEQKEIQKENFTEEEIEELQELAKKDGIKLIDLEIKIIEGARAAEVSIKEFMLQLQEIDSGTIEQKIQYAIQQIKEQEEQQEI